MCDFELSSSGWPEDEYSDWPQLISHMHFYCPCIYESTNGWLVETHHVLGTPVFVLWQCPVGSPDYLQSLVWIRLHMLLTVSFWRFLKMIASASRSPSVALRNGMVHVWQQKRVAIFKNMLSLLRRVSVSLKIYWFNNAHWYTYSTCSNKGCSNFK